MPDRPTLTSIVRSAPEHGDRIAVVDGGTRLTYAELHLRAQALADALTAAGVLPGHRVAVHVPRSADAVIVVHAALLAGAVVAPTDPSDPPHRIRAQVAGAAIDHVIAEAGERAWPTLARLPGGLALLRTSPDDSPPGPESEAGSYLLFTSGSTGTPKGVLLDGAAVAHFARWAATRVGLGPTDRVASQAALTFDLSTFDLFATAIAGAAQVIVPEWLKAFPADLAQLLADERISVIYAVPTLLRGITAALAQGPSPALGLRSIIYAGEPYPPSALAELISLFPSSDVHNFYGPTETNVCLAHLIRTGRGTGSGPAGPAPIGRPIDGVVACIVDDELEAGASEGELVVAGPPLLRGYTIDGRLTDPTVRIAFPDGTVRRAYRTGDRARVDADGVFRLIGRSDRQVKRRGHRIDLEGIGVLASGVHGVTHAAAVLDGGSRIVLFVEPAASTPDPADGVAPRTRGEAPRGDDLQARVKAELRDTLPAAHQPDVIAVLDRLPVNARGKTDVPGLRRIADAARDDVV